MPTYEYECDACGHRLEQFQRMADEPLKQCPACGKNSLRRLFGTGAAIVFKGSGFYQTDYRSASYKSAAEKESKDSGGKSDAKPAAGSKPASDTSTGKPKSDSPKPKGDSAKPE